MTPGSRALLFSALLFGVFVRFFHADWKVYSGDEAITSLRVSGHTLAGFEAFARTGTHRLADLAPYEAPATQTPAAAVVDSLRAEDPQHPPLFYLAEYSAVRAFGDTIYIRRLPAIVFGVLAIFAAWFCGRELFRDERAAAFLAALVAVSPLHVAYAQEAREYSLWTLGIFLASALLLRTLRTGRGSAAATYAVCVAAGLWSHLFFGFVIAAHAAYAFLAPAVPVRTRTLALGAAAAGTLGFVPWLPVIFAGTATIDRTTPWEHTTLSPLLYLGKLAFDASTTFFDLSFISVLLAPIALFVLALSASSLVALGRSGDARVVRFVALLGLPPLVLILNDALRAQTYALQGRYLMPTWVALELAAAYAFAVVWRSRPQRRALARAGATALLACGVAAVCVGSYARWWWVESAERYLPETASALAARSDATLVYADESRSLLALGALPAASVPFALHPKLDAAALASAKRPFALTRASEIDPSLGLIEVTLPDIFPPARDPLILALKRAAAHDRGLAPFADEMLFTRAAGP